MVLFLQGVAHWMEHFLTAPMTQLISLSFFRTCNLTSALHEREIVQLFWRRTNSVHHPWRSAWLFQGDKMRYPCRPARKTPCLRRVLPMCGPNCTKDCRDDDWLSLTRNYALMLKKVCDEVSTRLCFWLTAAIAIRQERLPSLLVDPACELKLAWCEYMQGLAFALAEIEGCRRCHVAATTVDISRTAVAPMVHVLVVLFSFFVYGVVARCRDVVGSSTRRTRSGTSINSTPDMWLRIAVAQCENMFVGSHAPHTRVMGNAFTETRFAICGSRVKDCTSPPCASG